MKIVAVPNSVDTSVKLQALIDSTGNTAAKYVFSEDHDIVISSRLRVFNNTEWIGNGCKFTLMENAPVEIFGEQVPLIAPKYPRAAEGLIFHGIEFNGNRDSQSKVPKKNGKNWGLGYHNFFTLGDLRNVSYSNSRNCEFYDLSLEDNLGDGIRVEGGTKISVHDITGKRGGHDIVCYSGVLGGEVYNLKADLAVNAGVRTRSAKNIKIHDCFLNGDTKIAYSPGIQIQSTAANWVSSGIEIYNNHICKTWGPGILVMGDVPNNGNVYIHNNLFVGCGAMPKAEKRPNVGAIVYDGFPVVIEYNTAVECYGFGFVAGDYTLASRYSATATIKRNIVTGTKKALYPGKGSGAAIANLLGSRYTITCVENDTYGNISNFYNVTCSKNLSVDPLFVGSGDYHLQPSSPCRFNGYQLGRYNGTDDSVFTEKDIAKDAEELPTHAKNSSI
jgi:hypothetical protein